MASPITRSTLIAATSVASPGTSTTTASVTYTAGNMLVLSVAAGDSGNAALEPSSISGLGLTWIEQVGLDSGTSKLDCSMWTAIGTAGATGTIVITWASGTDNAIYHLEEFAGAYTVRQVNETSSGSQTAMTLTLPSTPLADSVVVAAMAHNDTAGTVTAGTNFTKLGDATIGSPTPSNHLAFEWNNNNSPSATATITNSNAGEFSFVAMELTSGPSAAGAIASTEAFGTPLLSLEFDPTSIASAEAFGVPTIAAAGGVWPDFIVEVAWANKALDLDSTVVWTDISAYLRSFRLSRSRSRELARFDAGTMEIVLDNRDARFSPEYSAGQYFPYIRPNKRVRVRASHGPLTRTLMNAYANSWSERFVKPKEAVVVLSATDGFKLLARYELPDSWQLAIAALLPIGWWRLNERTGTTFYNSGSKASIDAPMTTSASITLDQAPLVPGADSSISRSALFASTSEGSVASPGVIPVTTSTSSITFRSASRAYNLSDPFSLAVSKPTGVVSGDLLVAHVGYKGSANVSSVPSGWTLVRTADSTGSASNDAKMSVYWKAAGGSEPSTYSWSFDAGGDVAIVITAWIGANTSSPIDVSGATTNASTSATTCTAPAVTTTQANDMLITGHFFNPSTSSTTALSQSVAPNPTPSMTEAADTASKGSGGTNVNSATMAVDYGVVVAASLTVAKTTTIIADDGKNVGVSVAIKAAAGGVGAVPTPFTVMFWFSQAANQTANADAYVKQGSQFVVFQDIADNKITMTLGASTLKMNTVPSVNTSYLMIAQYDGAASARLNSVLGSSSAVVSPVVGLTAAAFEFGLAQATLDEVTVLDRYIDFTAANALINQFAAGVATSASVVGSALDGVGWPSDLRAIQSTGAVSVSNLVTAANAGDKTLDYLQDVTTTERGVVYMNQDGQVAFETLSFLQSDATRITPVAVFGSAAGEIGYTDLTPDYSDQIIYNDIEVTNTTTDAGARAAYTEKYSDTDTDSISEFSTQTLSLETNYDSVLATRQAAIASRMTFELSRYAQPQRRIQSLTISGTPTAADWDTLLTLVMLNRITVNHVAPAVDATTGLATTRTIASDYTIRQLDWEYQASPRSVKLTIGLDEGAV